MVCKNVHVEDPSSSESGGHGRGSLAFATLCDKLDTASALGSSGGGVIGMAAGCGIGGFFIHDLKPSHTRQSSDSLIVKGTVSCLLACQLKNVSSVLDGRSRLLRGLWCFGRYPS